MVAVDDFLLSLDDDDEDDDDDPDPDVEPESDDFAPESDPDDPLLSDDFDPFEPESEDDVVDFPRLSVLKNPDPLKVTPTGWKTFLTGNRSPVSGWTCSVRVSSVNACWTSMVSPVSTNL